MAWAIVSGIAAPRARGRWLHDGAEARVDTTARQTVPPERPGVAVDRGAAVEDGVTVRDGGGTAVGVADGRAGSRAVVRVLGGFSATVGDDAVNLGGPRQRAVLARILIAGSEAVTAEQVLHDVWGERSVGGDRRRGAGVRLAAAPSPRARRAAPPGRRLRPRPRRGRRRRRPVRRRRRRAAAGRWPAATTKTPRRCSRSRWPGGRARVRSATARRVRCRSSRRSPPGSRSMRVVAAEALADAHARQGRAADDVALLEELAARDPLRESVAVQLVRALYAAGRQADALAAYDRCRGALADELGVEPTPALRRCAPRCWPTTRCPASAAPSCPPHLPPAQPVVRRPPGAARGRRRDAGRRHPPPARRRADRAGRGGQDRAGPGAGAPAAPARAGRLVDLRRRPRRYRHRAGGAGRRRWGSPRSSGARTPARRCGRSWTARRAGCSSTTTRTSPPSSSRSCPRPGTATSSSPRATRPGGGSPTPSRSGRWPAASPWRTSPPAPATGPSRRTRSPNCSATCRWRSSRRAPTSSRRGCRCPTTSTCSGATATACSCATSRAPDRTVATTWGLAFDRLAARAPRAADLLETIAFLAPDADLRRDAGPVRAATSWTCRRRCGELLRLSLVDREADTVRVHRLVQDVVARPDDRGGPPRPARHGGAGLRRRRRPRPDATSPTTSPRTSSCSPGTPRRSAWSPDGLVEALERVARRHAKRALYPAADHVLASRRCGCPTALDGDPAVRGRLTCALGQVLDAARPARAGAGAAPCRRSRSWRPRSHPDDVVLAHAHNRLGHVLNCADDAPAAIAAHRRALDVLHRAGRATWSPRC